MTVIKPDPHTTSVFPVVVSARVMFAAYCWTLSLGFFVVDAIVQPAWAAPYSMVDTHISDLGATGCGTMTVHAYQAYVCAPLNAMMNGAGAGTLAVLGAVCGRAAWPKGHLATTGTVLIALAGVGAIIAGLFPEDTNPSMHLLGALLAVPMPSIGMGLLALAVRRSNPGLSAFTGAIVLVGLTGLLLTGTDPQTGAGFVERFAGHPFEVWKVVVAIVLFTAWLHHHQCPDVLPVSQRPDQVARRSGSIAVESSDGGLLSAHDICHGRPVRGAD